jgi:hypothetical protein
MLCGRLPSVDSYFSTLYLVLLHSFHLNHTPQMFFLPRIECHATIPRILARAYCTVPVMFWILQFSQPQVLGFVFKDHPESSTLNQCWDVGRALKLHLELGLIHLIGSCLEHWCISTVKTIASRNKRWFHRKLSYNVPTTMQPCNVTTQNVKWAFWWRLCCEVRKLPCNISFHIWSGQQHTSWLYGYQALHENL